MELGWGDVVFEAVLQAVEDGGDADGAFSSLRAEGDADGAGVSRREAALDQAFGLQRGEAVADVAARGVKGGGESGGLSVRLVRGAALKEDGGEDEGFKEGDLLGAEEGVERGLHAAGGAAGLEDGALVEEGFNAHDWLSSSTIDECTKSMFQTPDFGRD